MKIYFSVLTFQLTMTESGMYAIFVSVPCREKWVPMRGGGVRNASALTMSESNTVTAITKMAAMLQLI